MVVLLKALTCDVPCLSLRAGTEDESVAEEGEGGKESEPAEQGGEERACVRMAYR